MRLIKQMMKTTVFQSVLRSVTNLDRWKADLMSQLSWTVRILAINFHPHLMISLKWILIPQDLPITQAATILDSQLKILNLLTIILITSNRIIRNQIIAQITTHSLVIRQNKR